MKVSKYFSSLPGAGLGMPSDLGMSGMAVGPALGSGPAFSSGSAFGAGFNGVDETGFGDALNMGGSGVSMGGRVSLSKCTYSPV